MYRYTLEGIIDKYSQLDSRDNGMDLDLETASTKEVERCMNLSKLGLSKNSAAPLREPKEAVHLNNEDIQMDYSTEDDQWDTAEDKAVHLNDCLIQDKLKNDTGVSEVDHNELTQNPMNETQGSLLWDKCQPEDQNEELEGTLSSNNSTLLDLYPSMLCQIGEACRRQYVVDAAGSVLKRYHRMRWSSCKKKLNNCSLNKTVTHGCSNIRPDLNSSQTDYQRANKTSKNIRHTCVHAPQNLLDCPLERKFPSKLKKSERTLHPPILVMNFTSGPSPPLEFSEQDETFKNQSFTESHFLPSSSHPREEHTALVFSPARSGHPISGRFRNPNMHVSGGDVTPNVRCHYRSTIARPMVSVASLIADAPSSHRSPDKQCPFVHCASNIYVRNPQSGPAMPNLPLQRPIVSLGKLHCRDSNSFSQSKPSSKSLPIQVSPNPSLPSSKSSYLRSDQQKLQQQLSLDSSLSSKQLDEKFEKLYRTFVCQGKSPLHQASRCRFCVRSHSSLTLAALALSPHHLRKRHRELDQDQLPQSKRSRDSHFMYSPGSLRQKKEMLRPQHSFKHFRSSTLIDPSSDSVTWSNRKATLARARSTHHRLSDTQIKRDGYSIFYLQAHQLAPVWEEDKQYVGIIGKSPKNDDHQRVSSNESSNLSRRRLLYK